MDRLEFLKQRQSGIGGSDVGAIMEVDNFRGKFSVYLEKTKELTEKDLEESEAAYFGTNLEEFVANEFSRRTGKKVRRDNRQLVHKQYPFMIANIDRRVVGEDSILECITANAFSSKEWKDDELPPRVILQCQHYLEVTGAKKCYVAVLIGGQKFIIKELDRDEELIELIINEEKDFWTNYVEKRIPPSLDGSEGASLYIKKKYPKADSSIQVALKSEHGDKIKEYLSLKDAIKELENKSKALENNIKNELGNAEKGVIDNFSVFFKQVTSNRVDSKVLKSKYPQVYRDVCRESITRRFEVKEG